MKKWNKVLYVLWVVAFIAAVSRILIWSFNDAKELPQCTEAWIEWLGIDEVIEVCEQPILENKEARNKQEEAIRKAKSMQAELSKENERMREIVVEATKTYSETFETMGLAQVN